MNLKHTAIGACFASLSIAAMTGASLAVAGVATMVSKDGNSASFEYRDNMLRIDGDETSYAIVRDGSLYSVIMDENGPIVMDAGSLLKGMGAMQLPTVTSELDGKLISFDDTGKNETVAGIEGDVYELVIEEDGKRRTETLVLSSDARVREFSDAMFSMMSFATDLTSEQAQEQGQEFQARLNKMDAGVLRFGDEMKISKISGETVPMERFELPAEPMNLNGFGDMLKNMSQRQQQQPSSSGSTAQPSSQSQPQQKSEGGLLSSMIGALGGKKSAADNSETEAETDAEEGKKNPFGKTFGKLFGKDKD